MDTFLPAKNTILVVDDTPANLALVAGLLQKDYIVKAANHGSKALKIVQDDPPDMILLDILMPDMDGYEVCRRLKENPTSRHIPVIFLTSQTESEDEELGLELGAVDYITRPINPRILLSRVRAHFFEVENSRAMRINNEYLELEVAKRTRQLEALQDVAILALASLAETRDIDTGNHLRRTQNYVRVLAEYLQDNPRFHDYLTPDMITILYKCAPLHDIGKVGIPDKILLKPGRYVPEEFEIMKRHPTLGRDAIDNAQKITGEHVDFLEVAKDIVYAHHEKWDGSGYPLGLAGDAIPIAGRLMALADVYDALISPRVYKAGMPHAQAEAIIVEGRGRHFDPDVVDAFLALREEFQNIAIRYADSEQDLVQKAELLSLAG
jgi:putative two-component system response regulator